MYSKNQLKKIFPKGFPFKRELSSFAWSIIDLGLSNDDSIQQSFLESSCHNLELIFRTQEPGIIVQKDGQETLTFLFEWEIDHRNCSIIIEGDHPLFAMRTRWNIQRICSGELRLSYQISTSGKAITIMMLLEGKKIERKINARQIVQMMVPFFNL